jgi:hypothetical protein
MTITMTQGLYLFGALFAYLFGFHIFWTAPDFSVQNTIIESVLFTITILSWISSFVTYKLGK